MKTRIALASLIALWALSAPAHAQVVPQPGPPFNIACAYNATPVTLTDGQAGWIQCNNQGFVIVTGTVTASFSGTGANNADNVAAVATGLVGTASYNYVWDGAAWDRLYGDSTNGAFVNIKTSLSQAPVAPATATATKAELIGCQATSAGINPTTGQQAAVDCDLNNNLLVSSGGAPNIATAQVSVTTGNITVAAARALRRSVKITNVTGTSAIYCGNTGVATTTGDYLGATSGSWVTYDTTAAIFCTVPATTQTVTVAETY